MADERTAIITCPACGTRRSRTFSFCPKCGQDLPDLAPPAPPRTTAGTVSPLAGPVVPITGTTARRPVDPPPDPPATTSLATAPAPRLRYTPSIWHLRWILPIVTLLTFALVVGKAWFGPPTAAPPKQVILTLHEESWQPFDPRASFGTGREFFVRAERPIRIRTARGKPVVTGTAAVALGDLGGEALELRSVKGVVDVVLLGK
jgi:hypothetical protein